MGRGGYALGVDLGTTFTAAAVTRDGSTEVVMLGASSATVPSVIAVGDNGETLVGPAAESRGASDPTQVARQFKRRFGDSSPMLVGGTMRSAQALTADLLRWVVELVTEREGAPPSKVVVTHPANWKSFKLELLEGAIEQAGVDDFALISEPVGAAIDYANRSSVDRDDLIAVYDLGGGTFDATILERNEGTFETLGEPRGIEHLGGIDFDSALLQFVIGQLPDDYEIDEDDPATATALGQLRQSIVQAKIALSSDTSTAVPVLLPGAATEIRVTREDFEQLIAVSVRDSIGALERTLDGAGRSAEDLAAVLLVGGSSRIPLVGRLIAEALKRPVAVDSDPKLAIARGASAHAASLMPAPVEESEPAAVPPVVPPVTPVVPAVAGASETVNVAAPPEVSAVPAPVPEPVAAPEPVAEAEPPAVPTPAPEPVAEAAPAPMPEPAQPAATAAATAHYQVAQDPHAQHYQQQSYAQPDPYAQAGYAQPGYAQPGYEQPAPKKSRKGLVALLVLLLLAGGGAAAYFLTQSSDDAADSSGTTTADSATFVEGTSTTAEDQTTTDEAAADTTSGGDGDAAATTTDETASNDAAATTDDATSADAAPADDSAAPSGPQYVTAAVTRFDPLDTFCRDENLGPGVLVDIVYDVGDAGFSAAFSSDYEVPGLLDHVPNGSTGVATLDLCQEGDLRTPRFGVVDGAGTESAVFTAPWPTEAGRVDGGATIGSVAVEVVADAGCDADQRAYDVQLNGDPGNDEVNSLRADFGSGWVDALGAGFAFFEDPSIPFGTGSAAVFVLCMPPDSDVALAVGNTDTWAEVVVYIP
ncbi:MAG: Hsp70 family protein [Actinomycetota bacterium]